MNKNQDTPCLPKLNPISNYEFIKNSRLAITSPPLVFNTHSNVEKLQDNKLNQQNKYKEHLLS